MKQIIYILIFLTGICTYAQQTQKNGKQVQALKVAFITNELSLTPGEAAEFWPIYNAFDRKIKDLKKERKRLINSNFTGSDASQILTQVEATDEKIYFLQKKLITDIKAVIQPLKILQLKKAEEDFNRKLLKQYRSKK